MQMFTTFGSFSIAAGILLIFLIFVMLAAERRTEMGVARAIGTRRGHLVQTFLFEGAVYDVVAAAHRRRARHRGVVRDGRRCRARGRHESAVAVASSTRCAGRASSWPTRSECCSRSLVVALSAWRVSVVNIVTAIRNLPDARRRPRAGAGLVSERGGSRARRAPDRERAEQRARRCRSCSALRSSSSVCVPVLRAVARAGPARLHGRRPRPRRARGCSRSGSSRRWCRTRRWTSRCGSSAVCSSWWARRGPSSTTPTRCSAASPALFGRVRALAGVLRISAAYPLKTRLRTGMTFAMFTLVVFTLVVGTTTTGAFVVGVRARRVVQRRLRRPRGHEPAQPDHRHGSRAAAHPRHRSSRRSRWSPRSRTFRSRCARPESARSTSTIPFAASTTPTCATRRTSSAAEQSGTAPDRAVWDAVRTGSHLAVVDANIVPHRRNWNFGAITDLRLHGFFAEDKSFQPVPLDVRDPETGRTTRVDRDRNAARQRSVRGRRHLDVATDARVLRESGSADDLLHSPRARCERPTVRGSARVRVPGQRSDGRLVRQAREGQRRRVGRDRSVRSRASWGSAWSSASPRSA